MICPKCQTKYPQTQRFCFNCLGEDNRSSVLIEERTDPKVLSQYRSYLEGFLEDGFLEEGEKQILADLRRQMGVSEQTHVELLKNYDYRDTFPVDVGCNFETLRGYGVNQHCLVMLKVFSNEEVPLRTVVVRYRLNHGEEQSQSVQHLIKSRNSDDGRTISLPFFPTLPGQYTLTLEIDVEPFGADSSSYLCESINFQVFTSQQFEQIHVHQSADHIVGDMRFRDNANTEAKLLGHGGYSKLKLRPKSNTNNVKLSNGPEIKIEFEDIPVYQRFEVEFHLSRQHNRKLSVSTKERVTFGKDRRKSDLRMAIEPFSIKQGEEGLVTPEMAARNKDMTLYNISGLHFAIFKQGETVMIEDCQSTYGTLLDGQALTPNRPVELPHNSTIHLCRHKVLELKVSILPDSAGVLLTQPRHYPQREHLILWKHVGFSNFTTGIVEPFDERVHHISLEKIGDKACFVNYSRKKVSVGNTEIGFQEACPIHSNIALDIGAATVIPDIID